MNNSKLPIDENKRPWLERLFAIDLRALAVFRMALALLILGDLFFFRWPNVEVFLSDQGAVSRQVAEQLVGPGYWSLYSFDGSVLAAKVLIAANAFLALGLLIGWRTRSMALGCLVLAWSIQVRNPLVLSGGDVVLRMLLWWSVFLPLGGWRSVDAWLSNRSRPSTWSPCSFASAAILIQIAMVYFFAGWAKWNDDWLGGTAIQQALSLEIYTKPFGRQLTRFPVFLSVANYGVLVLELVGAWFIFSPWKTQTARWALLIAFCSMHIGIWLTMSIGLFSLTMMVSWILFLPPSFWDRCFGRPDGFEQNQVTDYPVLKKAGNWICLVALLFCLAINMAQATREHPAWYRNWGELFAKTTMLVQEFNLWGQPPKTNPKFKFSAEWISGNESKPVDLLSWYLRRQVERPESEYTYLHSQPWRRFFWAVQEQGDEERPEYVGIRQSFKAFLVKQIERQQSKDEVRWVDSVWGTPD